uniref:SWI/SNF-related matrix-associated actin-dependent regulator of chromatin subfamily A-like protein 1 n=1 Tax=Myxine glutinosa TaxID=7769 RepID=UPI00358F419A
MHKIPGVRIEPLPGRTAPPPLTSASSSSSGTLSVAAVMLACHSWRKPLAVVHGQCVLMSRSRFILEVTYHADIVALCKAVRSRSYDATTKQWSFLLEDYMDLMEQACQSHVFEIEPLPQAVVQAFLPQFQKSEKHREPILDADLSSVEQHLTKNLLPFQLQGVNLAVAREGRLLIADDMGLGKTVQAICIAAYYRQDWPLLVVAPSSVRFTWAEAFRRWLPSLDPQEIQVVVKCRDKPGAGVITIISYDLLSRMQTQVEELAFPFVIMDESHFLKNIKTMRCRVALSVMKIARRLLLLSGTPAMSRPMELYTQLMALQPRLFPNVHEFGLRYCAAHRMPWGWDYTGSSHMTELRVLLEETLLIRRLKADVLTQLPAKQRKMIVVESGVVDARARTALAAAAKNSAGGKSLEKKALLLFFSKTAEAKVFAVNEYIHDLLESTESKFLVFGHHKVMLDRVSHGLEKKNVSYIRIDGSTGSAERQALCDRFQREEKLRVAVLSITAASMGLTLSAADLVIFAELFWNPGILIQAEDRVHRIGQNNSVNIHYLVARGTSDDYLWPMILEKLRVLGEAGLSGHSLGNATLTSFHNKGPKQQSIMELLQRSLSEDDIDDEMLLAAERATETSTDITKQHPFPKSPNKKRKIDDWLMKK